MNKRNITISLLVVFTAVVVFVPIVVSANELANFSNSVIGMWGLDTDPNTPASIVVNIINVVLTFLGLVTLFLVIYGGTVYLLARGDSTKASKGRKIIMIGIIGVLIVLASWGISYFVFSQVNIASEGGGSGSGEGYACKSAGGGCTPYCDTDEMLPGKDCPYGETCCLGSGSGVTCVSQGCGCMGWDNLCGGDVKDFTGCGALGKCCCP